MRSVDDPAGFVKAGFKFLMNIYDGGPDNSPSLLAQVQSGIVSIRYEDMIGG